LAKVTNNFPNTLPCPDGGGTVNEGNADSFVPADICVGTWEITGKTDECATSEANIQASYVAETLNISGAPLNVYKMLGVHDQSTGSVLSEGVLYASSSAPGFPITQLNGGDGWKSLEQGSDTVGTSAIVLDFGIKKLQDGQSEYAPPARKFVKVGSIYVTQGTGSYTSLVEVDLSDGSIRYSDSTSTGEGELLITDLGPLACPGTLIAVVDSGLVHYSLETATETIDLGSAQVGQELRSSYLSVMMIDSTSSVVDDTVLTLVLDYTWRRAGVYPLTQSTGQQVINLQSAFTVSAVRLTPAKFVGAGNWSVLELDAADGSPTDINNIQDIFLGENRDRDYAKVPVSIKAQYTPMNSVLDFSRLGLSILDQFVFTVSFETMVAAVGRPIVIGDIIELPSEASYDQNLKLKRKYLEVSDVGWAADGYSTAYAPLVYRFNAAPAVATQETRDLFGTLDTAKYQLPANDMLSEVLNTIPLAVGEDTARAASDAVPEVGSNDVRGETLRARTPAPPVNPKGQPPAVPVPAPSAAPGVYVESALPPDDLPYTQGYVLPDIVGAVDGEYFRLNYADHLRLPSRLYRFSAIKNRWIYLETDRRGAYTSHKPSARAQLSSPNAGSLTS
jgi:hypothetical protein